LHVRARGNMRAWFYGRNLKERDSWEARIEWDGNIKTNLKKIQWEVLNFTNLAQDRTKWRAVVKLLLYTFGFHKTWELC